MLKRKKVDIICALVGIVLMAIVLLAIPSVRVTGEETWTQEPDIVEEKLEEATKEVAMVAKEKVEELPKFQSLGEFNITAYCSCEICCGEYALNRPLDENGNPIVYGASGEVLIPEYSVAVDPEVIPYGTKIYIDGKEYIAHDCGGLIKGNDIDVYFTDHQEAWDFASGYYQIPTEVFVIVSE